MNYTRNEIIKEIENEFGKLYNGANSYVNYSHKIKQKENELGIIPRKYKNKDDFEYCLYNYEEYKAIVDSIIRDYINKPTRKNEILISTNQIKQNAKQRGIQATLSSSVTKACQDLDISPKEVIANKYYFSTNDAEKILEWIMAHCGTKPRKRINTQPKVDDVDDKIRRLEKQVSELTQRLEKSEKPSLLERIFGRRRKI